MTAAAPGPGGPGSGTPDPGAGPDGADPGATRRARRSGGSRPGGRARAVVAAVTSLALLAASVIGALQLQAARDRAAEQQRAAEALALTSRLAAEEADFLSDRRATARADAATRSEEAARAAREQAAAEQAEAEARAAAEAQAAADAEAAAQAQADAEARAAADARAAQEAQAGSAASGAPPGAPTHPRIAGWVDGRPVDADGNVLWVTSVPTADGDGSNGHMPASAMCVIPWGTDQLGFAQYLRCDAADALTALNDAFRAQFGAPLDLDLTYRSYDDQVAMKAAFGGLAAAPGTSSHGLGTALDVQEWPDTYGFGTARYDWLVANGPAYGWYAPERVREGQPYAEYWHFEYGPGRTS